MTKATMHKEALQELLDFEPLQDGLEALENVLPPLAAVHDEDTRRDLPELLQDPIEAEEIQVKFDLLIKMLESSQSVADMASKVDETYREVREQYEENMQTVFSRTKPFEKTARSLHLLYENTHGDANVYIMPVSAAKFADAPNPKHFDQMRNFLRKKFYKWHMEESPFYITFIGDIGSKSAMDKMGKIAQETLALAIMDVREMSSAKAVMDYADRVKIAGIPAHHGHIVIPGTWVYAQGAFDVDFIRDEQGRLKRVEKQMSVPASCALVGKLLEVRPGVYISGFEAEAIVGINGVKVAYDLERIDAKEWDRRGLVQIEPYGHIQGATTANKSNNYDLRKFPKVDTANALLKDLVQYCNNKAFSKWGEKQKRESQREIEIYLNSRMRQELIEGYKINKISYDQHEEAVEIDITIFFYEVADEFDVSLHGPKNEINVKKREVTE